MDSLNYYYYPNTNQLRQITDNVPDNGYVSKDNLIADIDNQPDNNYGYDAIGNLIKDSAEKITNVEWNVYGKIKKITRIPTTNVPASTIEYSYDAQGNRISQIVTTGDTKAYTWYVRDAQGNILTTYTTQGNSTDDIADLDLKHDELYMYGSSRLGSYTIGESVDGGPDDMQFYHGTGFNRGQKQYELTNHLGNVLTVISDRKFGIPSGTDGSLIDHYEPHIVSAQDYYPFGMISRIAAPANGKYYKFGFNGKMNDNEVKGLGNQQDYGMRIYDPRVGRFLSVDPLQAKYPWYTPYQYAGNKPIRYIDLDGLEEAIPKYQINTPKLTNPSESTCIGCIERSRIARVVQNKSNLEKLKREYEIWRSNPQNIGKPVSPEYAQVAGESPTKAPTFQQGGYQATTEYKLAKANYDTYGKYLPGISDIDDFTSFLKAVEEGKGDEATIFAMGFIVPEVSGKMFKGPLHHIFTNKNFIRGQQWSKKFAPLFEKAGYTLDDAINKIHVPGHMGPHPDEYHEAVFKKLIEATEGLEGNEYKKAFENTLESLQKEVSTKGTELNKLLTKEK